jgi:hypothetical protein
MMRAIAASVAPSLPLRTRSELLCYSDHLFECWEAGNPANRVRVLEVNAYRAVTAAGIELGVSAEKIRAQRVPNVLIVDAQPIESTGLA